MNPALYIDPENRLSRVPYKVPNNTHYVTLAQYQLMELQLKAECQARQAENSVLAVECDSLKAEVERLTAFTTRTIIPNEELQAQVERLTKAGDAMAHVRAHEVAFDEAVTYDVAYRLDYLTAAWHAAKEGKQS
jgi:hypothetical protein